MAKRKQKKQSPLAIAKRALARTHAEFNKEIQKEIQGKCCEHSPKNKRPSFFKSQLPKDLEYSPLYAAEVMYTEILKVYKKLSKQELIRIGIELNGGDGAIGNLEEFVESNLGELIERKIFAYDEHTDMVTIYKKRK